MEYAKQHHLSITCIDVEMITLYNGPNKYANKSLWISILNIEGHLLYESLVKYPQNDINLIPDSIERNYITISMPLAIIKTERHVLITYVAVSSLSNVTSKAI